MKQQRRKSFRFASLKKATTLSGLVCLIFFSFILAACGNSGETSDTAGQVVVDYYEALTNGDVNLMRSLSCADWEEDAQLEFDAFAGVTTRLNNLQCQSAGTEGEFTQVSCTGGILATYGNEDTEFDLSSFTFRTLQEAGEWRMCGY
jgi:hypothetical protein